MHLRKLIWVCGFACALLSNMVAALGLGEVRLNSTLNEPLNAEIKLLDTRGLSAGQIIVTLASPADFERNGVDRPYFLTEFQFEIALDRPGGAVVLVTSRSPVREPFINFLVEARWPTGRLLREYTLLMDLPTFAESPARSTVHPPATRASPSATTPAAPAQARAPAPSRPQATQTPSARSGVVGDSYSVGTNDTLWQIALDIRPDSSHSVHQTMLAIQRLNPDAFINGNINLLRAGQVLRVPTSDDIRGVSRSEAVSEVARQNEAWSDDSMGAQLSATRRDSSARRDSDAVSGSVRLASPGRNDTSAGQGSGSNTGSGRALETELAASLEELDKTKSENQELSSRVRDLEDQIRTMERLVEVSNEQLRALQLSAAQNNEAATTDTTATDTDVVEASRDEIVARDTGDTGLAEESANQAPAVIVAEETPVVSEPAAPVDNRRVVAPAKPAKTLVDHLMDNLLWVLLAILFVVALVGAAIYRRRQEADADSLPDDDFFDMDSPADQEEFETAADDIDNLDADDAPLFDEEEIPAEAETGDVVGEADIYIAYGKFDQAEEMLLAGLAKDPDSVDIRLKLLEVYSQTQNAEKFDRYYAGLIGLAGQPALARAAELREHISNADEFDPTSASRLYAADSVDISTADDAIDLDDSPELSDDEVTDDDLDFSLDLDEEPASVVDDELLLQENDLRSVNTRYDLSFDETAPAVPVEEDEFSFDFDLDNAAESETVSAAPAALDEDELSFELDDLEPAAAPESETRELSLDMADELEDLNFDLEESTEPAPQTAFAPASASADLGEDLDEDLQLPDDATDDFNLDMEMNELDLVALDESMGDLDEELVLAEEREELEVRLEENADSLFEEDTTEFELRDDASELSEDLSFDEPIVDEPIVDEPVDLPQEDPLPVHPVVVDTVEEDEEDVFDQALSEFSVDTSDSAAMPELEDLSDEDMDAELDFLADADEAATKLDLARAYIDMGDTDGARDILAEVAHEGNDQQRQEAVDLLSRIDS